MPLTQNILQAARTQMAVTLSAKKPLEERQEERWHVDESLMQRAVKNASCHTFPIPLQLTC